MTILGEMIRQDGIEIGKEIGVGALVESLTELHIPSDQIVSELMKRISMDQNQAEEACQRYAPLPEVSPQEK